MAGFADDDDVVAHQLLGWQRAAGRDDVDDDGDEENDTRSASRSTVKEVSNFRRAMQILSSSRIVTSKDAGDRVRSNDDGSGGRMVGPLSFVEAHFRLIKCCLETASPSLTPSTQSLSEDEWIRMASELLKRMGDSLKTSIRKEISTSFSANHNVSSSGGGGSSKKKKDDRFSQTSAAFLHYLRSILHDVQPHIAGNAAAVRLLGPSYSNLCDVSHSFLSYLESRKTRVDGFVTAFLPAVDSWEALDGLLRTDVDELARTRGECNGLFEESAYRLMEFLDRALDTVQMALLSSHSSKGGQGSNVSPDKQSKIIVFLLARVTSLVMMTTRLRRSSKDQQSLSVMANNVRSRNDDEYGDEGGRKLMTGVLRRLVRACGLSLVARARMEGEGGNDAVVDPGGKGQTAQLLVSVAGLRDRAELYLSKVLGDFGPDGACGPGLECFVDLPVPLSSDVGTDDAIVRDGSCLAKVVLMKYAARRLLLATVSDDWDNTAFHTPDRNAAVIDFYHSLVFVDVPRCHHLFQTAPSFSRCDLQKQAREMLVDLVRVLGDASHLLYPCSGRSIGAREERRDWRTDLAGQHNLLVRWLAPATASDHRDPTGSALSPNHPMSEEIILHVLQGRILYSCAIGADDRYSHEDATHLISLLSQLLFHRCTGSSHRENISKLLVRLLSTPSSGARNAMKDNAAKTLTIKSLWSNMKTANLIDSTSCKRKRSNGASAVRSATLLPDDVDTICWVLEALAKSSILTNSSVDSYTSLAMRQLWNGILNRISDNNKLLKNLVLGRNVNSLMFLLSLSAGALRVSPKLVDFFLAFDMDGAADRNVTAETCAESVIAFVELHLGNEGSSGSPALMNSTRRVLMNSVCIRLTDALCECIGRDLSEAHVSRIGHVLKNVVVSSLDSATVQTLRLQYDAVSAASKMGSAVRPDFCMGSLQPLVECMNIVIGKTGWYHIAPSVSCMEHFLRTLQARHHQEAVSKVMPKLAKSLLISRLTGKIFSIATEEAIDPLRDVAYSVQQESQFLSICCNNNVAKDSWTYIGDRCIVMKSGSKVFVHRNKDGKVSAIVASVDGQLKSPFDVLSAIGTSNYDIHAIRSNCAMLLNMNEAAMENNGRKGKVDARAAIRSNGDKPPSMTTNDYGVTAGGGAAIDGSDGKRRNNASAAGEGYEELDDDLENDDFAEYFSQSSAPDKKTAEERAREQPDGTPESDQDSGFNHVPSEMVDVFANSDDNVIVSAPTWARKMALFKMAMVRLFSSNLDNSNNGTGGRHSVVSKSRKAVYLAPNKALCMERHSDWYRRLADIDPSVVTTTITDDRNSKACYAEIANAHLIVTTPEKWDSITQKWNDQFVLLAAIKLVLVDEVHLIDEPGRGGCLKSVIVRMKTIQRAARVRMLSRSDIGYSSYKNTTPEALASNMRIVAISATMPNLGQLASFVDSGEAYLFDQSYRPVPLSVYVQDCGYIGYLFDKSLSQHMPAILRRFSNGRPAIVFCLTKKETEMLADELSKSYVNGWLNDSMLTNFAGKTDTASLQRCLRRGIAYHHAGVNPSDRGLVEEAFGSGSVSCLCATSTLAMGVKLPSHLVIIKGTMAYRGSASHLVIMKGASAYRGSETGHQDIDANTLLQMIERAGLGFDKSGKAVIIADSLSKRRCEIFSQVMKLIEGLNIAISQGVIASVEEAIDWVKGTFLCHHIHSRPLFHGFKGSDDDALRSFVVDMCTSSIHELRNIRAITIKEDSTFVPNAACHIMSRNFVDIETMKAIVKIPHDSGRVQLLQILASCATLQTQVRPNEKKHLDEAYKLVKYKLKGPQSKIRIQKKEEKAFVVLQAAIGQHFFQDYTLRQQMSSMIDGASQILLAIEQYSREVSFHHQVATEGVSLLGSLYKGKKHSKLNQLPPTTAKKRLYDTHHDSVSNFNDKFVTPSPHPRPKHQYPKSLTLMRNAKASSAPKSSKSNHSESQASSGRCSNNPNWSKNENSNRKGPRNSPKDSMFASYSYDPNKMENSLESNANRSKQVEHEQAVIIPNNASDSTCSTRKPRYGQTLRTPSNQFRNTASSKQISSIGLLRQKAAEPQQLHSQTTTPQRYANRGLAQPNTMEAPSAQHHLGCPANNANIMMNQHGGRDHEPSQFVGPGSTQGLCFQQRPDTSAGSVMQQQSFGMAPGSALSPPLFMGRSNSNHFMQGAMESVNRPMSSAGVHGPMDGGARPMSSAGQSIAPMYDVMPPHENNSGFQHGMAQQHQFDDTFNDPICHGLDPSYGNIDPGCLSNVDPSFGGTFNDSHEPSFENMSEQPQHRPLLGGEHRSEGGHVSMSSPYLQPPHQWREIPSNQYNKQHLSSNPYHWYNRQPQIPSNTYNRQTPAKRENSSIS